MTLPDALDELEMAYGHAPEPVTADPWETVVLENVAYLADDRRREEAFLALKKRIGLQPEQILGATNAELTELSSAGIMAGERGERLKKCARIALEEIGGEVETIPQMAPEPAFKLLRKFPGIGEPSAEKILLFAGMKPVLGLESNGLRVLVRFGIGEESDNYGKTYRSAQKEAMAQLPAEIEPLKRAHLLLRRHGQTVCRRTRPQCGECAIATGCRYFHMRR